MRGMTVPDIERWSERVVVVRGLNPGPFTGPGTNTFLVGSGERPILIDTGSGQVGYVPLLAEALRTECKTHVPGEILVTHTHPDHLGGAAHVLSEFGPRSVSKMPWPERDGRHPVEIQAIGDGDVFRSDGATLRAVYTPGHAKDHLCFLLEEENALFTGDVVLGAGTTVVPLDGGDMRLYLDSLDRMLAMKVDRIYPGHGPMITEPAAKLREYIDHRSERESQILEAVRGGARTVEEMVEKIYVDVPRHLWPAAGQSVLSHLMKLEDERRAARTADAAGVEHWALA